MSRANQTHPAPEQLRAFALGRLPSAELAALAEHVQTCAECCARLEEAPDDTFLARLRGSPSPETVAPEQAGAVSSLDLPAVLADHPRYRILRLLGAGGMGVVYHAVHRLMEREVALKVINPGLVTHPVALERFRQEWIAVARLSHPNVVSVHDAEQAGDVHFLVMEYVEGTSLDRLVARQGPLPVGQACHFIRQAALGLQHAHERGMVHRDIKPHNLMVTRKGQVKVLDFGLARLARETAEPQSKRPLTTVGTVLGTPDYISPEQVNDSRAVDVRADIYSLGCTLYFLLAGRPPFPEGNGLEKAFSHLNALPKPLRSLRPEVPPELMPVVDRMMAKVPEARYQTPVEVAQALAPFARLGGAQASREASPPPVSAETPPRPRAKADTVPVPPPPPEHPRRRKKLAKGRRKLLIAGLAVGAGLLGVAALAVALAVALPRLKPGKGGMVGGAGDKARVLLVLPHQQFYWRDYEKVERVLREGGTEVVVASSAKGEASPDRGEGRPVPVAVTIDQAKGKDYQAIVFSGGGGPIEYIKDKESAKDARRLIDEMMRERKPIAGLCTGTAVLGDAGVLRGKKATGFGPAKWVLKANGAEFVDQDVVEEGNLITGRDDRAAEAFARRILGKVRPGR